MISLSSSDFSEGQQWTVGSLPLPPSHWQACQMSWISTGVWGRPQHESEWEGGTLLSSCDTFLFTSPLLVLSLLASYFSIPSFTPLLHILSVSAVLLFLLLLLLALTPPPSFLYSFNFFSSPHFRFSSPDFCFSFTPSLLSSTLPGWFRSSYPVCGVCRRVWQTAGEVTGKGSRSKCQRGSKLPRVISIFLSPFSSLPLAPPTSPLLFSHSSYPPPLSSLLPSSLPCHSLSSLFSLLSPLFLPIFLHLSSPSPTEGRETSTGTGSRGWAQGMLKTAHDLWTGQECYLWCYKYMCTTQVSS